MVKFSGYVVTKVGEIPDHKLKKLATGASVTLSYSDLHGDNQMLFHPENAKKIAAAKRARKGVRIEMTHGEIDHDLAYHNKEGMAGGSFWSKLSDGLSSAWNTIGKPIASAALDGIAMAGQQALNGFVPGVGDVVAPTLRQGVKSLTGVGVRGGKLVKGSQEARDHMARLRSMQKSTGGSFRLN
jgi:hypothetical protein